MSQLLQYKELDGTYGGLVSVDGMVRLFGW